MRRFLLALLLSLLTVGARGDILLVGVGQPPTVAGSTLLNNLISYWTLDEASGTRADSVGGNTLTDNNTVTSIAGVVSNAAVFTRANSEYLSHVSNAALQTGDISFTVATWFRKDSCASGSGEHVLGSKYGASKEWLLYSGFWNGNQCNVLLAVSSDGTTFNSQVEKTGVSGTAWHFVVAWHDATANTINVQVDNGTVASQAYSSGLTATSEDFALGKQYDVGEYLNGRLDEFGFWKRTLTAAEKTCLYNSGSGRTYPFVGC